ncbi:MAG: hypothetical protein O2967_23525 [Proteobacteria bacterium]|nr:hypothetical protein [Pseudomonadota bacterium]
MSAIANRERLINCPRCGEYVLTQEALTALPDLLKSRENAAEVLSYFIRRIPVAPPYHVAALLAEHAKRIIENEVLPTPAAQADNLLRWIGKHVPGPGETVDLRAELLTAVVGGKSEAGVMYILKGLDQRGLIQGYIQDGNHPVTGRGGRYTPSFAGWERIEELQRGAASGNMAFMAMKYRDKNLDPFVQNYFVPAVKETGFHLRRLDDNPRAGLIDNRLRVEIQSCRFLVADLTHANNGAYWEAGYAEGLGKPVIYTCEKSVFDDKDKGTHFDANHHQTVVWTYDDPDNAAEELKATIRATLPEANREISKVG